MTGVRKEIRQRRDFVLTEIKETVGVCINSNSCKNFKAILGNGLCIICWDKGYDKRIDGSVTHKN